MLMAAFYNDSPCSHLEDTIKRDVRDGVPVTSFTSMDRLVDAGNLFIVSLTNGPRGIRHLDVDISLLRNITLLDR